MSPKLIKRVLHAANTRNLVRTVNYNRGRYTFGWTGHFSEATLTKAQRAGWIVFEPPTEKLDNPFVAAGGVGGHMVLTDAGRAKLAEIAAVMGPRERGLFTRGRGAS